ncbi:MAG: hypothetical protein ACI868_001077, partial [Granulosicoccus sp.]
MPCLGRLCSPAQMQQDRPAIDSLKTNEKFR